MFSFLTPYLTYIKLGLIAVVVLVIASLYAANAHNKAAVVVLSAQIAEARAANAENVKTIEAMRADAGRAAQLCGVQLGLKDKTIAELRKISVLTEGGLANAGDIISSGNALLDALNSVSAKAGYQGGICKASGSGATVSGSGQPDNVLYCFAAKQDALNYLYNRALHDGREAEMEAVLKSFQTTTQ